MAAPVVLDMQEGEVFMLEGGVIKLAIQAQADRLKVQLRAYMVEVQGEIEALNKEGRAGLFLEVMRNKDLSPPVLLVSQCLARAVACQNEIDDLLHIYHNITEHQGVIYKLNLRQLKRYGMVPRAEG